MSKKRNYRLFLFGFLLADLAAAGALGIQELKEKIPDTIYLRYGEEKGLEESLDIPLVTYPDSIDVSERGSYRIPCSLLGMIPLKAVQAEIVEDQWVYVSGTPVGLYMETQGLLIVDTGEITNEKGIIEEPAANIVQPGDYILEINGKGISRKKELISEIEKCGGEEVELLVNRKGEEIPISLEPVFTQDEEYKLGIWVRDNTQGIGTLTYIDQEGKFGALGHGISDTDTGELLDVSGGELYQAQIISIIRGKQGTPGELSGYIEYEEDKKIGTIEKNTDIGIFGKLFSGMEPLGEKVKIGYKQEVKEGKAFEKRSTYIYQDIIDNIPLDGGGIHVEWINETMPEKHDVVSEWRRNIPAQEYYDTEKPPYHKKCGEEHVGTPEKDYFKKGKFWYKKCNRMWNFKKAN